MPPPITVRRPNTIRLSSDADYPNTLDNTHLSAPTGTAIIPGMFIELANFSGTLKYQPVASATNVASAVIAEEQIELSIPNGLLTGTTSCDTPYLAGSLVKAWTMRPGDEAWALVGSGVDITIGDRMQQAGGGLLKEATADTAAAGVAQFRALETLGAVNVLTRLRVQKL